MSEILTSYKIFIATPSGLEEERRIFRQIVQEYNENEANERQAHFIPVGWEQTLSNSGRPQDLINLDIMKCDFFILLLHDRWGSPPSNTNKYSSGTEEEFHVAMDCLKDKKKPMCQMVLFFKDVPEQQKSDPGPQLSRVLTFRKEREGKKDFLYQTFDSVENFKKRLLAHLGKWTRMHENGDLIKLKEDRSKLKRISTKFKTNDFKWIESIIKNKNCDLAIEQADIYEKEGKLLEAELIYSQIATRTSDPSAVAKYGRFLRKNGRTKGAEDFLNRALNLSITGKNKTMEAYSYRQLGRVIELYGQIDKALEFYSKAFKTYEDLNDLQGMARTLRDIGILENKKGNIRGAIKSLKKSIDYYKKIKDQNGIAASLGYLGVVYKNVGLIEKALTSFTRALEINQKFLTGNNEEAIAKIKSNIAVLKRQMHDFQEAESIHKEMLEFFIKHNDLRFISQEYSNIGVIKRQLGDFAEAEKMHLSALEIAEKMGNERSKAIQYGNLGLDYIGLKQFDRAEMYIEKSLKISREIKDQRGISHQYRNYGYLYLSQNQKEKAERFLRKSLEIDISLQSNYEAAWSKRLLGECIITSCPERKDEALRYLADAKKYFSEINLTSEITTITDLIKKYAA